MKSTGLPVAKGIGSIVGVLLWSAASIAGAPLEYGADPAAAAWQFDGSRTACRLTHEIPNFGEARFVQEAGRPLAFDLSAWRVVLKGDMDVSAEAPAWLVSYPRSEPLGRVSARSPHEVVAAALLAETMLRALYQGEQPKLASSDVGVSLSAVGFRPTYDAYARCVSQLLPASFEQLERSAIVFAPDQSQLSDAGKARLDLVADYVRADRSVKHVQVEGHTDSSGRERKNRVLSEQRAKAVVDYLVASGLDVESIDTRFHGSRFPVASNKTEEGRAQNRRVTVRLERQHTKVAAR
jgi:outer membrane protein OmpA-like peptidoglycan-associated protein